MSQHPNTFPPTRWSIVLSAQSDHSEIRSEALGQLCRAYWHPVYAYVRHRGLSPTDAEDVTQGFFAHLLSKAGLSRVREANGKLRSFLLASVRNYMANEWRKQNRKKRGGGVTVISMDSVEAEKRACLEGEDALSPERIFERHWAMSLIRSAIERLEISYREEGKGHLFDHLKEFLETRKGDIGYRKIGEQLGMTEIAVRTAVSRLRKRYRALLIQEITNTLQDGDSAEDELRYLFAVFGS